MDLHRPRSLPGDLLDREAARGSTATFDPCLEMVAGTEHDDLAGGVLVRAAGHYRLPVPGGGQRGPPWRAHERSSHVGGSLAVGQPSVLIKSDSPKRGAQVLPPGEMKVTASVELDIGDIGTEVGQTMLDDAIGGEDDNLTGDQSAVARPGLHKGHTT